MELVPVQFQTSDCKHSPTAADDGGKSLYKACGMLRVAFSVNFAAMPRRYNNNMLSLTSLAASDRDIPLLVYLPFRPCAMGGVRSFDVGGGAM